MTKTKGIYNLISRQKDTSTDLGAVFSFFFLTHFLRRDNGAVRLSPIAINLFAALAETQPKQTKSLQSLTHVGFFKAILAIPKQSTFIFAKRQAKINKLRCSPTNRCASHFFARALNAPQCAPQACGIF